MAAENGWFGMLRQSRKGYRARANLTAVTLPKEVDLAFHPPNTLTLADWPML